MFSEDLEGQPLMKTDATNIGDSPHPTMFQSTDVPYPVELVKNRFHTHVNNSAAEQSSASMTIDDLPDTLDHNPHSQVSSSDEPYIVTPAQLKSENQEADVKYEVDKEGNAKSVMDNMDDISEPAGSIPFMDSESTNKTLPALIQITSLKQEETNGTVLKRDKSTYNTTVNLDLTNAGKVKADRPDTEQKPYKCDICEKTFNGHTGLRRHSRIHTGEKPYECEICGKSFAQSSDFTRHRRIHTGERPYKCSTCEKSFFQRIDLTRHSWIHTGEKAFKCNICEKTFVSSRNLTKHKWVHADEKPFKCDECGSSYPDRPTLMRHSIIHTGEKPYKCQTCGKSFANSGSLWTHKKIHTGLRPYKCNICEKSFVHKPHLAKHRQTMHKAEMIRDVQSLE